MYTSYHMSTMSNADAMGILAMLGAFMFVFAIIGLVLYLFYAIGLYQMAKNDGVENAWLAFIPIGHYYVIGKLTKGNFTVFGNRIESPEVVLPISMLVGCLLAAIPFVGFLIAIALVILQVSAVYHLFRKYKGDSATGLTVLCVLVSIVYPFMIFSMRNATPVDSSYGGNGGSYDDGYGGNDHSNYNNY